MIRGLDSDETVFLDMVAEQQEKIANRRFNEESQEIKEYRVWVLDISIYIIVLKSHLRIIIQKDVSYTLCLILSKISYIKVSDFSKCLLENLQF